MAATDIEGSSGAMAMTGGHADFQSWTGTIESTVNERTTFAAAPWPTRTVTGVSFSGSATGIAQFDDTGLAPIAALTEAGLSTLAMTLTATTGCTYGGNFTISNIAIDRPSDGACMLTFTFASTGTITQTWDEGA